MKFSHFSLPSIVANVENDVIAIEHEGKEIFRVAVADCKAFRALIATAERAAVSSVDKVRVVGKPKDVKPAK
jgi:hypothetical protein